MRRAHMGNAVKELGYRIPAGVQLVTVYNAKVTYTRSWAKCQGSEVKREGPSFKEPQGVQRESWAQIFLTG